MNETESETVVYFFNRKHTFESFRGYAYSFRALCMNYEDRSGNFAPSVRERECVGFLRGFDPLYLGM